MSRGRYSDQFKREAVRLVTDEGYSINRAAEAVGVVHTTLSKWVARLGTEMPQSKVTYASDADEVRALREENRRLRMERDILKKAAVFFANDQ